MKNRLTKPGTVLVFVLLNFTWGTQIVAQRPHDNARTRGTILAAVPSKIDVRARYLFYLHVNVSRTFAFGTIRKSSSGTSAAAAADNKYKLSLGVRIVNLFNNVNLDLPTGNLSSPFFGQPTSTSGGFGPASIGNPSAGNRRIEAQLRFDF